MKKHLIVSAALAFCLCAAALAEEAPAESPILGVTVNCSVPSEGQRIDTIEIEVADPEPYAGLTAEDFTLTGTAHWWDASQFFAWNCASEGTYDFEAEIIDVIVKNGKVILTVGTFPTKYYYVEDLNVECAAFPELSFTRADVTAEYTAVADEFETITRSFEGQPDFLYYLYTPKDTSEPLPLVICFHGLGDNDSLKANRVVTQWAEPDRQAINPCYVLGAVAMLDDPFVAAEERTVDQAMAVAQEMIDAGLVDASRIYVTGKSMGGGCTMYAAINYADFIAAAMPLCPAGFYDKEAMGNLVDLPIMFVQATNDKAVDITGTKEAYAKLLEAGSTKAFFKEYHPYEMAERGVGKDNHHDVEMLATESRNLSDWLFAQSK